MKGRGNKAAATGANVSIHAVAENALSPDRPTEDVIGADAACPGWISSHSAPGCPVPGGLPANRALPNFKDTIARDAIINILIPAVPRSLLQIAALEK
jgi:hypothetical protein